MPCLEPRRGSGRSRKRKMKGTRIRRVGSEDQEEVAEGLERGRGWGQELEEEDQQIKKRDRSHPLMAEHTELQHQEEHLLSRPRLPVAAEKLHEAESSPEQRPAFHHKSQQTRRGTVKTLGRL